MFRVPSLFHVSEIAVYAESSSFQICFQLERFIQKMWTVKASTEKKKNVELHELKWEGCLRGASLSLPHHPISTPQLRLAYTMPWSPRSTMETICPFGESPAYWDLVTDPQGSFLYPSCESHEPQPRDQCLPAGLTPRTSCSKYSEVRSDKLALDIWPGFKLINVRL